MSCNNRLSQNTVALFRAADDFGFEVFEPLLEQCRVRSMLHEKFSLEMKDGNVVTIFALPRFVVRVKNVDGLKIEARI